MNYLPKTLLAEQYIIYGLVLLARLPFFAMGQLVMLHALLTRETSSPFSMMAFSSLPLGEPDATSSRRRSPEDRWVKPYLATILSHCVPLPLPGPPTTNTTLEFFRAGGKKERRFSITMEFFRAGGNKE